MKLLKYSLFVILSFAIVGCSSSISTNEIASKMPNSTEERKSIIFDVPSTGNLTSNFMYIGMLKTIGSNQVDRLSQLLTIDNINIGISGKNTIINKAVTIEALNKVEKAGRNIELYMIGSSSDKEDLEKITSQKKIVLHYFSLE